MTELLARLRSAGWMVAVHNDYFIADVRKTFWLFTHRRGYWVKGEGSTDAEALARAWADARVIGAGIGETDDHVDTIEDRVAFAILRALHAHLPPDGGPLSWSDLDDEQAERIRRAAREAIKIAAKVIAP